MPVAAVIPIRSFRGGKDRLSEYLDPGQRQLLGQGLSERVVMACEKAGMIPAVVTADPEVAAWAGSIGAAVVPETGSGLNAAAATGADWAAGLGLEWAIIHSDLPLIDFRDLTIVESTIRSGQSLIAASSDGGTSVLSNPEPIEFSYGEGSFHRHLSMLDAPRILYRKGLAHDLDTVADLVSVTTDADGEWVRLIVEGPQGAGQHLPKI